MLRLAAALDRGRGQVVDSVDVELSGGRLRLTMRSNRNCELELWATGRQSALLERVFGRHLDLAVEGLAPAPQTAISFGSVVASAR